MRYQFPLPLLRPLQLSCLPLIAIKDLRLQHELIRFLAHSPGLLEAQEQACDNEADGADYEAGGAPAEGVV